MECRCTATDFLEKFAMRLLLRSHFVKIRRENLCTEVICKLPHGKILQAVRQKRKMNIFVNISEASTSPRKTDFQKTD